MVREPSELYRLAVKSLANSDRWFGDLPETRNLAQFTLGLTGEAGEVANLVAKISRKSLDYGDASTRFALGMELADVLIYLLNICALLGIDPMEIYNQKNIENERKFNNERDQRILARREAVEIVDGIRVSGRR